MTEKRQEKESTISPWRVRDYRSWFVADTASALGTTIGGFAFTLVAYAVSHDVTTAGMVGTVFALCEGLGTLPGGHLSDRIDRKKLMIVFGLISAATLCVMTLALVAKMMSAPLLFLFAIVRGLTSGVFSNVSNIILPQIVTGNQLVQAYSANESRDACIQLFSKPLSGFLYGLGPEIPFLISAVLYALMSVATPLIRSDLRPKNDASPSDSDDSTKKNTTKPHWRQFIAFIVDRRLCMVHAMATSSIRIQQCALVELCPHPDGQHCDSESTDAEHSRLADWAHLNRKRCRTAERVVSDHSPCQPSDGRQNSTSLLHHHHGRMRFTAIHPEYISTGRMHGDHESHGRSRQFRPWCLRVADHSE